MTAHLESLNGLLERKDRNLAARVRNIGLRMGNRGGDRRGDSILGGWERVVVEEGLATTARIWPPGAEEERESSSVGSNGGEREGEERHGSSGG